MSTVEIISLVVTLVCVASFSVVFTILFRNYYLTNIEAVKTGREDLDLIENAIYEERENKSRGRKTLRIIGRVSEYVILGAISAFFLFSVYSRFMGNALPFGDYSMIVIATDSMSMKNSENKYLEDNQLDNQFNAYDVIGVSAYKSQDEVKLYDVVAYKDKDEIIIVHRIREIVTKDGEIVYHVRGDKNSIDDDNVRIQGSLTYDRIIGYYNGNRIQDIGIFVIFVQSNAGIITIVSIVYCLMMYDNLNNKYLKAVEERTGLLQNYLHFDAGVDDINDFDVHYRESLHYKGKQSVFEHGEFVSTLEGDGSAVFATPLPKKKDEEEKQETERRPRKVKGPKAPKEDKVKKERAPKEFASFLDHLDDTEDII